jgi:tetratricopeptide (TPR) repeat protein
MFIFDEMRTPAILACFFALVNCRPVEPEKADVAKLDIHFEQIVRVMDYADAKKYSLAIELCDSILSIDPVYERAYFERAMVYMELDSSELARNDFEKLLSIDRQFPDLRNWYSRFLADEGNYLEAARLKYEELGEFPRGTSNSGTSPYSWVDCAEYFYKAGRIDSAIYILDEYFTLHEKYVEIHRMDETAPLRMYATLMIEKDDLKNAVSKMETAMKSPHKVPADYEVWIELNILTGEHVKARQLLDYYINEVHDGVETEAATRLKKKLK